MPFLTTFSIQRYAIKFDRDLRQVGGFHQILWFPPSIKAESGVRHHIPLFHINSRGITLKYLNKNYGLKHNTQSVYGQFLSQGQKRFLTLTEKLSIIDCA